MSERVIEADSERWETQRQLRVYDPTGEWVPRLTVVSSYEGTEVRDQVAWSVGFYLEGRFVMKAIYLDREEALERCASENGRPS